MRSQQGSLSHRRTSCAPVPMSTENRFGQRGGLRERNACAVNSRNRTGNSLAGDPQLQVSYIYVPEDVAVHQFPARFLLRVVVVQHQLVPEMYCWINSRDDVRNSQRCRDPQVIIRGVLADVAVQRAQQDHGHHALREVIYIRINGRTCLRNSLQGSVCNMYREEQRDQQRVDDAEPVDLVIVRAMQVAIYGGIYLRINSRDLVLKESTAGILK